MKSNEREFETGVLRQSGKNLVRPTRLLQNQGRQNKSKAPGNHRRNFTTGNRARTKETKAMTFREIKKIMNEPETFDEWLKKNNDALPEPESFSEWLKRNNDSIEEEKQKEVYANNR